VETRIDINSNDPLRNIFLDTSRMIFLYNQMVNITEFLESFNPEVIYELVCPYLFKEERLPLKIFLLWCKKTERVFGIEDFESTYRVFLLSKTFTIYLSKIKT